MFKQPIVCRISGWAHACHNRLVTPSVLALAPFSFIVGLQAWATVDPGPRGGPAGAGQFIAGLTADQASITTLVRNNFQEINRVTGGPGIPHGLGPRFDSNSCNSCHAFPAVGGSSPPTNKLFNVFQLNGAQNSMPAFETSSGPTVIARFPFQSDLVTPDGHVQQLFVVTGRSDASGCKISQPDFATATANNNLILRQTTPLFGGGLVEIILDADIVNNMNANTGQKQALGISGHPNIIGDGSIGRFGWKAQARSLLLFAGEAYNIEEGVTNDLFPNEIDETAGCVFNLIPEDSINFSPTTKPVEFPTDPERFAIFMRFLDQPTPATQTPSDINGQTQFNNIGCVLCHTASFITPQSSVTGLSNVQVNLFSDLLVHHMGPCLADRIMQGTAQGDEFRTAPLWGVGQRIFFMHDGRTSDIVQAVQDHFCVGNSQFQDSEANAVVNSFNGLSNTNQQDLINFLRSL